MILLCDALQPLCSEAAMLLGGAAAPSAKGLLNPGDDAQHGIIHRNAGDALGLDGPWRLLVYLVEEVDGRGGASMGWHACKR